MPEVHIVIGAGIIIEAYRDNLHAQLHAKTILGARVVSVFVRSELAPTVRDDLALDNEWAVNDADGDTPVLEISHDLSETDDDDGAVR